MATVAGHQTIGAPTSLEKKYYKVVYDFAVDGGSTGDLTLFTFDTAAIITDYIAHVDTSCAGATMTLTVGTTDDANAFEDAQAVAGLTAGAVFAGDLDAVKVAAADIMKMAINTADLTAGKITFMIGVVKAGL